ncbi:neutral zinc metallopeptidase [Geminocystis sp. GBBB08]|uniref:neutral zinc metallopeptidase n=1 Tax=Geminocystis sp. GBBB08 TaxID=2604140 RepID=UPI0027E2C5C2|nr:neutral zinc metallopeptidase [Geminocystis sp. GBBB08]MBL1208245.1 metalloprotease [Geminocystis sp. GBBB08]
MKINIVKTLVTLSTPIISLLTMSRSIAQEWHPDAVIQSMYAGVAYIHGYKAIPRVYKPIPAGSRTRCGVMVAMNAFYCPLDHSIYISNDMIAFAYRFGDAALAYIIGHEYAHAMQNAYGFNRNNSHITELQADCLSGFYMKAVPNIVFDQRDIQEIQALAYSIGDHNRWSRNHHGTPSQRLKAVTIGMSASNLLGCF